MSTHKAAILEAYDKPIRVKQVPTPAVGLGSILVSPIYSSIQSYARQIYKGIMPVPMVIPLTPGGSGIGRVEAVGSDAVFIKPGDIVWVDPAITARDDPETKFGRGVFAGISSASRKLMADGWRDGFFSEKILVPLEGAWVLPESLFKSKAEGGQGYHYKDLATLTTCLVAYGGLESAGVGAGSTVIVAPATGKFGGGAVLVALAVGAKVIAAGRNEVALKKLQGFPGAKERLTTVQLVNDVEKDAASLLAASGGSGAHVYIDFLPPAASGSTTPTHVTSCIMALRRHGQAILAGGLSSNIEVNYVHLLLKDITIRGQFMYEYEQIQRFIRMLENGNLRLGEEVGLTIAGTFPLDKVEEALELAEKGIGWGNDVLLAPNGEQ